MIDLGLLSSRNVAIENRDGSRRPELSVGGIAWRNSGGLDIQLDLSAIGSLASPTRTLIFLAQHRVDSPRHHTA